MNFQLTILVFIGMILLLFFLRSVFTLLFSMENYNIHKKRLRQLKFQNKKDIDASELIDIVTKPAIKYLLPKIKLRNLEQLGIDLKMAKWNKMFTPLQYRALNITLKIIGVIVFLLCYKLSPFIAFIWGFVLCFLIDILFRNTISNRKQKLFSDFPDFIRITQGYLSSNIPFAQAVEESIKYVGSEWKPILQEFVIKCNINSIEEALEWLKEEVDLYETKQFVSLVKLSLEQGGDVRESFNSQVDKIRELQMELISKKVGRREVMSIAIQAPLLLCNILVFGLPTIVSMTSFTSM